MPITFSQNRGCAKPANLLRAAVFLMALSAPATGTAQDAALAPVTETVSELSIESLMQVEVPTVYGASKYQQTTAEAPASVTVITPDEIKMYGYRNLAEILQSVRGFSMTYDRNYSYLGMRGFSRPGDYNSRILLLIDGIRINDNVYDEAGVGNDFPLDIDLIERVEVIRGPSHSLYGSNAFFGVINVITRAGRSLNGAEVSGEAGSFASYKGRLSYGRKFASGVEALVSGSLLDSRGQDLHYSEFDTPEQNNGWAMGSDGEHYGSYFLKLRYRAFTLEGGYLRRRKNIPTGSFGTVFNTPLNRAVDSRAFLDLRFEHEYDNRLAVLARVSFNRYNYDGDYLHQADQERILNKDYSRGDALGAELQLTKELFQRHKFVMGGEFRDNIRQDQGNYDSTARYLDDRRSSVSFGLYAQDEFTLLDNLALHGGIRYDHFDSLGGTFNPRLALVYSPLADTRLKLISGKAFRAPNSFELHYSLPSYSLDNPHLREETVTSYEAVLEQVLGAHLNATVSAYYNQMENIISQTLNADGVHIFENIDRYSTRGVEFELQGKWPNGIQGRGSYTLQKARRSGAVTTVPNSPRQLAKLNLIVPLLDKRVFLGLEEQFTDRKKTVSGPDAPQFFVTNLTLFSQKLVKGVELSASVYNLFNEHHGDPGSEDHIQNTIEQDGRTFRLKATYAF
jgi:outer membrane receptor for ferrienterochelin and colicins